MSCRHTIQMHSAGNFRMTFYTFRCSSIQRGANRVTKTLHNVTDRSRLLLLSIFDHLLGIEDEATNLDGLSVRSLRRTCCIQESRVRRESSPVNLGIITLNEGDLIGCLVGKIVPPVVGVVLHAERAYTIWLGQRSSCVSYW